MDKIFTTFYVLKLRDKGEGHNEFTGRYREIDWYKGISRQAYTYRDAMNQSRHLGVDFLPFKNITFAEIEKWMVEEGIITAPEEVKGDLTYQDKMKEMSAAGYDWIAATGGDRSSKSVTLAYEKFLNETKKD